MLINYYTPTNFFEMNDTIYKILRKGFYTILFLLSLIDNSFSLYFTLHVYFSRTQ